MTIGFNDGDGAQALEHNQFRRRMRNAVVTGTAVSPGTNDMTVQVSAGNVIHTGAWVSVAAQDNVALDPADSTNPRKDTVYVDGGGTLQVVTGAPEEPVPTSASRFKTRRPAPPDLNGNDGVVLAEVWVPAGASDITASDVRDRRLHVGPVEFYAPTLFGDASFVAEDGTGVLDVLDTGITAHVESTFAATAAFTATAAARVDPGVEFLFGADTDDFSLKVDDTRAPTEYIVTHKPSATEVLRFQGGNAIDALLESGGVHELDVTGLLGDLADPQDPKLHAGDHQSGGTDELDVTGLLGDLADPQDPKLHAASHKDGGADELDAAELAGALGANGEILKSDGAAAFWGTPPQSEIEASETDDGSDITAYTVSNVNSGTVIDITGSGKLLGGAGVGGGDDGFEITLTVDGGTAYSQSGVLGRDSQAHYISSNHIPPVKFETSLKLDVNIGSANETGGAVAWVKQ